MPTGPIKTSTGGSLTPDLVIRATGIGKYNSEPMKGLGVVKESGEVNVGKTLQVAGFPKIFSIGDVAATGGPKMAYALLSQVPVVVKNIDALVKGKPAVATYAPGGPSMFVTIGKTLGAGQLPMGNMVVGSWMVKTLKGKVRDGRFFFLVVFALCQYLSRFSCCAGSVHGKLLEKHEPNST